MNKKAGYSLVKAAMTLLVAGLFLVGVSNIAAETQHSADVKKAMMDMKEGAAKLGACKIEGTKLFFGDTKINGNYELVDALKAKHNCTATFFVKKEDGFVRVSTNVMKDGNRAIGTVLDPNGPVIASVRKGDAYYGVVDILGAKYDTGYEPIKNGAGEIIGVYYIGYPL